VRRVIWSSEALADARRNLTYLAAKIPRQRCIWPLCWKLAPKD
jgi:hypothetical protein